MIWSLNRAEFELGVGDDNPALAGVIAGCRV